MSVLLDVDVVRPRAGAVVVECKGEHDLTTTPALEELFTVLVTSNDLVVIDVSEAEFVDSSFLHEIVKADRLARPRGTRVRVQVGTASVVRRTLELSGILDRIENAPTRERAIVPFVDAVRELAQRAGGWTASVYF
jgi:anti-anti-sigma factor